MNFRKYLLILAVFLLTVLIVQPALSADDISGVVSNMSVTSGNTTRIVTNQTSDLEQDRASYYYNNAERVLINGHFENAIELFDQALALNTTMMKKTDALMYLYRDKAYAQIQLEKYNDAIITADAGLAVYPSDAMLWNNKGYALSRIGKPQDALNAFDTSISFDSNYTTAYINRGDILSQMGRYPEAVSAYTRAGETDPGNPVALEGLTNAKKGAADSARTMTIVLVIVFVVAIGIAVWYVRFRKPAEPEPEEKKAKSKKK